MTEEENDILRDKMLMGRDLSFSDFVLLRDNWDKEHAELFEVWRKKWRAKH